MRLILALLIALLPASAWAKTWPYKLAVTPIEGPVDQRVIARYTPALGSCKDKAEITNDIALCYKDEFARQDAVLNVAWAVALARVAPADRASLRSAQRAWVKARDPFCNRVMKDFAGGTMAGLEWWDCRAELSIRRTMWLETIR